MEAGVLAKDTYAGARSLDVNSDLCWLGGTLLYSAINLFLVSKHVIRFTVL